jgi:F0F1-type ATP synthase membrane subunit b/b'
MSTHEPERASAPPALTSLPAFEDLPVGADGALDRAGVREALDAYRRHVAQLQAQLRIAQGAPGEPSGHSIRMDALHLIRGAAEFADQLERDAQRASAAQLGRTEEEVRRRQRELQERERQIESFRDESERQRAEIVNAAQREARETTGAASASAAVELREAQAKGARLLEQSRHQAMELTNAARAEVEQTLEWARAQAGVILARAQEGAEQLLRAAGLGDEALAEVARSIVASAEASTESPAPPLQRPTDTVPVETFEREEEAPAADDESPSAESAPERPDGGEPRT